MVTKEQSLQNFLQKADEVIEGKYLFAIKKIEEMLMTISSSKILFEVFEHCYTGENLEKLKGRYFVVNGKTGSFTLPESKKQIIALSFHVLNQISMEEIDFNEFLTTYFPSGESFLDSYGMFINFLVVPFRNTVKNVVESVISASKIMANRSFMTEKPHLDLQYLHGIASILEEDLHTIIATGMKDEVQRDFATVVEKMIIEARNYRTEWLKSLFIAYKYASMHLKKVKPHVAEVEEMMADHGLLE